MLVYEFPGRVVMANFGTHRTLALSAHPLAALLLTGFSEHSGVGRPELPKPKGRAHKG